MIVFCDLLISGAINQLLYFVVIPLKSEEQIEIEKELERLKIELSVY